MRSTIFAPPIPGCALSRNVHGAGALEKPPRGSLFSKKGARKLSTCRACGWGIRWEGSLFGRERQRDEHFLDTHSNAWIHSASITSQANRRIFGGLFQLTGLGLKAVRSEINHSTVFPRKCFVPAPRLSSLKVRSMGATLEQANRY